MVSPIRSSISLPVHATPPLRSFRHIPTVATDVSGRHSAVHHRSPCSSTMDPRVTQLELLCSKIDSAFAAFARDMKEAIGASSTPLHPHLGPHGESSESEASAQELFKLRQTGSLMDYLAEFRRLATCSPTVGPQLLLRCFVWGLKSSLRFEMKSHPPPETVDDAITLAVYIDAQHMAPSVTQPTSLPLGVVELDQFVAPEFTEQSAHQVFDKMSNSTGGVNSDSTATMERGTDDTTPESVDDSPPTCAPAALSPLDVVAPFSFVAAKCTAPFAHNVFAEMHDSGGVGFQRKFDDKDGGCHDLRVHSKLTGDGVRSNACLGGILGSHPSTVLQCIKVGLQDSDGRVSRDTKTGYGSLCKVGRGSEFQDGYHRGIRDKGGTLLHLVIEKISMILEASKSECASYCGTAPPELKGEEGLIKNCPIIVLLDNGSTHNFIDDKLVKRIRWHIKEIASGTDHELVYYSRGIIDKRGGKCASLGALLIKVSPKEVTYEGRRLSKEAIGFVLGYQQMVDAEGVRPNEFTMSSILLACGRLGALEHGKWVHAYIDKFGMQTDLVLGTALVDMYAKCGSIEKAKWVFDRMGPCKDVMAWSSMISGLAMHGHAFKSLELFSEMIECGVNPNAVTFVGLLSACVHGGFSVFEGYLDANSTCVIDLSLGRLQELHTQLHAFQTEESERLEQTIENKVRSRLFGNRNSGAYCSQAIGMLRDFSPKVYILRKIQHKNAMQFIGACTRPPDHCMMMEFMSSGSIYDYLHKHKGVQASISACSQVSRISTLNLWTSLFFKGGVLI